MQYQVRFGLGELTFFQDTESLQRFCMKNRSVSKISFVGWDGVKHRFIMETSGGVLDEYVYKASGKAFPIGTLLFLDVPLIGFTHIFATALQEFSDLRKISIEDAYNCLIVKNAYTEGDFWMYLFYEEERLIKYQAEVAALKHDFKHCSSIVQPSN